MLVVHIIRTVDARRNSGTWGLVSNTFSWAQKHVNNIFGTRYLAFTYDVNKSNARNGYQVYWSGTSLQNQVDKRLLQYVVL